MMAQQSDITPLCAQAVRAHQSGDLVQAERLYREVVAEQPDAFLPRYLLGVVLFHAGRAEASLDELRRALLVQPHAEAFNIQGLVLETLGRNDEALASFGHALRLEPSYGEALNNQGNALLRQDRVADALTSLERAAALEPGRPQTWNNRAAALHRLGRLDDALASVDRALALDPRSAAAWTNRGLVLHALGRQDEALQSYDRAIAGDPGHAEAHWNKGLSLLLQGRFAEGWPLYEWRLRGPGNNGARRYPQPRWTGDMPLAGGTLYLYAEQGLGDTLQFCRYAALAAAQGARVVLSVQDSLVALLEGLPGVEVRRFTDAPAQFNCHAPLLSAPAILGTEPGTIPPPVACIRPSLEKAAAWAARLGGEGLRIGIAWQGKSGGTVDVGRSFPLEQLAPVAALPGVRLISLQKGDGVAQLSSLPPGVTVETLGEDFDAGPDAFADSAALLPSLDLVITSDTAIAHLAGTMGRPVWLALQHVPDWRWQMTGETTPWYPSMTLFRQPKRGDWASVFAAMRARLAP